MAGHVHVHAESFTECGALPGVGETERSALLHLSLSLLHKFDVALQSTCNLAPEERYRNALYGEHIVRARVWDPGQAVISLLAATPG